MFSELSGPNEQINPLTLSFCLLIRLCSQQLQYLPIQMWLGGNGGKKYESTHKRQKPGGGFNSNVDFKIINSP